MEFDFLKDYILEDDFVKLVPLKLEHKNELLKISNDPKIWTYFLEKGYGEDNLEEYIHNMINNRKAKKEYPFIVFDKNKNKFAGTTRFYEYSKEISTIKLGHTWYGESFRGTGINKHCKYLLFQFAFEKLMVERIGFGAYIDNKVSIAAMKSVGCRKEGVLRNMFPAISGKGRTDAILMSILKKEWQKSIKLELKNKLINKEQN